MLIYMTGNPSPCSASGRRDSDNPQTIQQILDSSDVPSERDLKSMASQHQANATLRISGLFTEQVPSPFLGSNARIEETNSNAIIPSVYSRLQAISLERHSAEFLLSIRRLFGPLNQSALLQYLKFAVYLSSNNMLSIEHNKHILEQITKSRAHSLFSIK